MAYQKKDFKSLIVKRISEDKEGRTKNFYVFGMSLSAEQEKNFNKGLKDLINAYGQELKKEEEEYEEEDE